MSEVAYLSASEALRLFRERSLSPVELLEAVIERAEAVEPTINAFSETRYDEALAQAKDAEARYARGERIRPLEGLALGIKDEAEVKGWSATFGSLVHRGEVADHTAPVAERILRSGAIVHARTTTPEFSSAPFTHSRLWGITRNPWNPDFAAGGSSGGSGAALAAGTATLASGSDIGGSIRIPASFNGVVGFKPPHGRVPVEPPFNLDQYCHEGPLARTVEDCALFENVMAGPHPRDVTSLRPKLRIPADLKGIEGWRLALSLDLGGYRVDDEVVRNTLEAAEALREAGAIVEEVDVGWDLEEIVLAARIHFGAIFGAEIGEVAAEHRELMTEYALAFADEAAAVRPGAFLDGLRLEVRIYEQLGKLLRRYRALICPTIAVTGMPAGDDYLGQTRQDGGPLDRQFDALMTVPFNICSRCPVLAVPSGLASNGVPTGIQIVGRTFDDVAVFRIGAALERVRPWLDSPERRPRI
jgi:aspartyl-tRNA(Asn)/glutamyl-tRNA(Gln) amidotransferase subunit A